MSAAGRRMAHIHRMIAGSIKARFVLRFPDNRKPPDPRCEARLVLKLAERNSRGLPTARQCTNAATYRVYVSTSRRVEPRGFWSCASCRLHANNAADFS